MPLVQVRYQGGPELTASIDSGSPLTIVDLGNTGHRVDGELRLEDAPASQVTRFVFKNPEVFDLAPRTAGLGAGQALQSVLGVPLLRNFVVRLNYVGTSTVTFKDEIPDSRNDLASDCDAAQLLDPDPSKRPRCIGVWGGGLRGGGLVAMGGDSWELPATRLVLPVCLLPDAFDASSATEMGPQQQSGVAATAVLATGQGTSIMSRSLLVRLRASGATLDELSTETLHLPYGDETVTLVDVDQVVAVSDETMDLGPCGELARRRRLLVGSRAGITAFDRDHDGASVASVQKVRFAVLDDTRPLIQGLRQELSAYVGDVDMVLGGSFLSSFQVSLDYPGQRVILECAGGTACEVLPYCSASDAPRCPDKTTP
jgi:hypothetical protein